MNRIRLIIGVVLIAGGVFLLARGVNYSAERNELQIGEFKATMEERRSVPPWVGGIAILGGVVLVASARMQRGRGE